MNIGESTWMDTMHMVGLCKAIETYFPVSVPGRREATDNPHALKLVGCRVLWQRSRVSTKGFAPWSMFMKIKPSQISELQIGPNPFKASDLNVSLSVTSAMRPSVNSHAWKGLILSAKNLIPQRPVCSSMRTNVEKRPYFTILSSN